MLGFIKQDCKQYLAVFVIAVVAFGVLLIKTGPNPSTDYSTVYEPEAKQIVNWLKGNEPFPEISPYQTFHIMYVFLIAAVFSIFGMGNLWALVIFQTIISIPVFLLIQHVSLKNYYYRWIAFVFTLISLSFLDNIQWTTWAVPDSFFRAFFVPAYFILLSLYFEKRQQLFLFALPIASLFLVLIRIDTMALFLPLYWFYSQIVMKKLKSRYILTIFFFSFLMLFSIFAFDGVKKIWHVYLYWYYNGWVLPGTDYKIPGLTQIEPFDYDRAQDIVYLLGRQVKLMALRFYQFINVFPPFWSLTHKIYYAIYMVPFYFLTIAGIVRAWKTKDKYFIVFFYVCLCSMVFHILTFVDAAKRQTFSVMPFFIMFAGYGFDYLFRLYEERFLTQNTPGNPIKQGE